MDKKTEGQTAEKAPDEAVNLWILEHTPLFKDLPEEEFDALARSLQAREVAPGTLLFREGERGDHFYIVIYGEMEVIKALGSEEERLIAVRRPGEFVGELSLINPEGLRTASVRARGPTQVWEMPLSEFDDLLHRQPKLAYALLEVLSARLTEAHNATVHDLQEKNRQLMQAYQELKAAQAQIVEKESMERELQVAYEIQMSILPQALPQVAGYDFGARIVPARAVGGDFFDVFSLGPESVGIVVGDVADKGVPSAIFMARSHALLYAEASRFAPPAQVLRQLNRHLMHIGEPSLFVTVLYGILDLPSGRFSYARAGHELPVLLDPTGRVSLAAWRQGQLLGLLDEPLLDEQTLTIPPGGTILLYTDGITDGRDPQGDSFGYDRLLEAIRALSGRPAQEVCDRLLESLVAFRGAAVQDDDVTLVAVRSNTAPRSASG